MSNPIRVRRLVDAFLDASLQAHPEDVLTALLHIITIFPWEELKSTLAVEHERAKTKGPTIETVSKQLIDIVGNLNETAGKINLVYDLARQG